LKQAPKPIGELEVTKVEPDLSYVRSSKRDRALKTDDKVQEKMPEAGQ